MKYPATDKISPVLDHRTENRRTQGKCTEASLDYKPNAHVDFKLFF